MATPTPTQAPAAEEKAPELRFEITVRAVKYELDLLKLRGRERALIEEQTGDSYGEAVLTAVVTTGIKAVPQHYLAAIAVARTQKGSTAEIIELAEELLDDDAGTVGFRYIDPDGDDEEPAGPTKRKLAPKPQRAASGDQS